MNYEDKYRELRATIKGRHSAYTNFLKEIPKDMEYLPTPTETKTQLKELDRLVEIINKLDK